MAIIVCEVCGAQINVPESKLASTKRCPDCRTPLDLAASGGALPGIDYGNDQVDERRRHDGRPSRTMMWQIALAALLAGLALLFYALWR